MEWATAWLIQWWELVQRSSERISAIAAVSALIISIIALRSSFRSARATEQSVSADQIANALSQRSVVEAVMGNLLTQEAFENEFKRKKGRAYWALYRAHNVLDRMRYFDRALAELAPVQDLLSVYGQGCLKGPANVSVRHSTGSSSWLQPKQQALPAQNTENSSRGFART